MRQSSSSEIDCVSTLSQNEEAPTEADYSPCRRVRSDTYLKKFLRAFRNQSFYLKFHQEHNCNPENNKSRKCDQWITSKWISEVQKFIEKYQLNGSEERPLVSEDEAIVTVLVLVRTTMACYLAPLCKKKMK